MAISDTLTVSDEIQLPVHGSPVERIHIGGLVLGSISVTSIVRV